MRVENLLDDVWLVVKCQSNWEIAGSLRKDFRVCLEVKQFGGKALFKLGGSTNLTKLRQTLNTRFVYSGVRTRGLSS